MKHIDVDRSTAHLGSDGANAPVIYLIDAVEHPFDIGEVAQGRTCSIVTAPVRDWNDSLTPWPAPGLYRGEPDFGGLAALTLEELVNEAIPAIEQTEGLAPAKRALCGYSLGGLFALYALTHSDAFSACACLSGSVWYQNWVAHLRNLEFDGTGRFAFLSIGSKEKHAAPKILHRVQDNMQECADILRERGCETEFVVGPGNHMSFVPERFEKGLLALEAALSKNGA